MSTPILNYAPRPEFDTGRFVAIYLQVLAWLAIASMVTEPIFFQSFHLDFSPLFLFWAAAALQRHSPIARKWVIGVAGALVALALLLFLIAVFAGTRNMTVTLGFIRTKNPSLWHVGLVTVLLIAVCGVPLGILLTKRAHRQFGAATQAAHKEPQPS